MYRRVYFPQATGLSSRYQLLKFHARPTAAPQNMVGFGNGEKNTPKFHFESSRKTARWCLNMTKVSHYPDGDHAGMQIIRALFWLYI